MYYLIIILIIFWIYLTYLERDLIKGFWRADADFCDQSELTAFVVYLGEPTGIFSNERFAYFLASNEEGIIINTAAKVRLSGMTILGLRTTYNMNLEYQNEHNEETLPSQLCLDWYPSIGKIVIYDAEMIYAVLYKDSITSSIITHTPDQVKEPAEENGEELDY